MEKRVNVKIDEYLHEFKDAVKNKILDLGFEDVSKASELAAFVYDYEKLVVVKDEIVKQKSKSATVLPDHSRCVAKRASGEQCTRRRKEGTEFCGTHCKGVPHGQVPSPDADSIQQHELFTEKIHGIVYFLDHMGHVYKTEEVLENIQNPKVIATWVRDAQGRITIPEFGLV
jgi:hypothetical protein